MLNTIPVPRLFTTDHRTVSQIKGPLVFVERIADVAYNEVVEIVTPDGDTRLGQVLEVDQQRCMVRIFLGTSGLDLERTRVRFTGNVAQLGVSLSMLGRVLDGSGRPIDGGPPLIPEAMLDINGLPINPSMRAHPSAFIQTGISAIDGLNTLTRGQKLPIISGAGLPANKLAAQIASEARVVGENGSRRKAGDEPLISWLRMRVSSGTGRTKSSSARDVRGLSSGARILRTTGSAASAITIIGDAPCRHSAIRRAALCSSGWRQPRTEAIGRGACSPAIGAATGCLKHCTASGLPVSPYPCIEKTDWCCGTVSSSPPCAARPRTTNHCRRRWTTAEPTCGKSSN